jgi:peptidyl-dipeptidase Dcp
MNKKTITLGLCAVAFCALCLLVALIQKMKTTETPETEKEQIINPFYSQYSTPYRTAPFDVITLEDYMPAIKKGIEIARNEIDAITKNPATPTFENTIAAMERSGEMLSRATSVFYNLNSAETSPAMQALAQEISPLLSQYSSDMLFNKALFDRIDYVYQNQDKENLTAEQKKVLRDTWKGYAEGGAKLSAEDQEKLREVSMRLSQLSLQFQANVLKETNAFRLNITDETQLAGLPKSAMDAAREEAEAAGEEGWTFTLKAPSYSAVMKYAQNRDIRKKMYMANGSVALKGGETDNRAVIDEIVKLRGERARILGYDSYAQMALEDRMAKDPKTVNNFLSSLLEKALPAAGLPQSNQCLSGRAAHLACGQSAVPRQTHRRCIGWCRHRCVSADRGLFHGGLRALPARDRRTAGRVDAQEVCGRSGKEHVAAGRSGLAAAGGRHAGACAA